jgi:hypothetical protein
MNAVSVADHLQTLEERLLDPKVRGSLEDLSELLADDFKEIGSSGIQYDKVSVISGLVSEKSSGPAPTIIDFNCVELAPGVALVTYQIIESRTRRSSIWRLSPSGAWQMLFHQGTRMGG